MEHSQVKLNDGAFFDSVIADSLPDGGDLVMVTKDKGTVKGNPIVMLTFTVQLPDGTLKRAQTVVTGRIFAMMAGAFRGRYGVDGDSVRTA